MTEISERYARNADAFAATVAEVPPDRWSAPSPCEGWTARDVVRHVIETSGIFFGLVGRTLPEGPSVDDDPAAAFDHVRRAVLADLDDPDKAGAEFDGYFGRSTFAQAVDRFLSADLVTHRWDLGTAAGLDIRLDEEEVRRMMKAAPEFGEAMRQPGVFGPELEPPADADEQTRFLAFTGRKAW